MVPSPTQVALGVAIVLVLTFAWYAGGGRWRARVSDRLLYGIPWGTLVIVGINGAFYLLAQGGLQNFEDPVFLPFVSWSYFYPLGMATAGIAHGSASHIIGNMAGTLVFAPIAEYVWGHHPPDAWGNRLGGLAGRFDAGHPKRMLQRPWVRAVVVFPGIMLAGALFTSLFSLGPGIGFSGVVFGIIGFAIVTAPLAAVVAVVAASALGQLVTALRQPIVRAGIESGAPGPPTWAGIGFQAHMLGFLIGVLLGVGLLVARERRPAVERVFFATVLVGLVQSLWLISLPEDANTFVLYRGAGTVLVLLLSVLVAVAAGGSAKELPRPLSVLPRAPTRRQIATIWLLILGLFGALGIAGAAVSDESFWLVTITTVFVTLLFAVPALPPLLPDRLLASPLSRRQAAVGTIAVFTALVGLVGVPYGFVLVDDGSIENSTSVTVEDYQIAYVDNGTTGHSAIGDFIEEETLQSNVSGVVVVSDQREMWTTAVQSSLLAHQGNASVSVGGVGWRETVDVERRGWSVVGNGSAYVVDLIVDGERTRSYTSSAVRADVRVDDHSSSVVPAEDGFDIRVSQNGSTVGTVAMPELNETATAGPLAFATERKSGEVAVFAESDGTRVRIGTREN
ncbi:MAG: rhomboid family intramembrane serine protease [Haloarculaceae archaeon]